MKYIILFHLVVLSQMFLKTPLYAENIVLKRGQKLECKIIEKTDKEIKIDFQGVVLVYPVDEIYSIDDQLVQSTPARDENRVPMISVGEMAETLNKEANDLFKQNPESAEANNKRGVFLRMRNQGNDLQESIVYFSKAIELSPGNAEYYHNRSISYSVIGSVDTAITDLDKAIELESNNPEFYFHRALEYFKKKNYDKCWVDIQKADSMGFRDRFKSEEGMFLRFIGDLHRVSGRNPYASKEENDAKKRANDYFEKGMFNEGINELDKIIQMNPAALYAYFDRALAYEKLGKFKEAIADYSKVVSSYPEHAQALVGRGVCLAEIGQNDAAFNDYSEAIKMNPNHFFAHYNRGLYYNEIRQYDQAIEDFNKCIEINPQDPPVYNDRAISYFFKGEYDKSWDDLHMAQKLGVRIHPGFLKELQRASGRND